MEIREKIKRILQKYHYTDLPTDEAIDQILLLFNVVGLSESFVCGHPPNQTYLNEGIWNCEKCGGKWNSLAKNETN